MLAVTCYHNALHHLAAGTFYTGDSLYCTNNCIVRMRRMRYAGIPLLATVRRLVYKACSFECLISLNCHKAKTDGVVLV